MAEKGGMKDLNSRVVLDRVGVAADAGGTRLCHAALEEGVAVGVDRVGVTADGKLLRSHWFSCGDDKVM